MKVRLSKKLAERLNGIDVSSVRAGDVLDVSEREAAILLAEQWAVPLEEPSDAKAQEPPPILPIPTPDTAALVPQNQPLMLRPSVVPES